MIKHRYLLAAALAVLAVGGARGGIARAQTAASDGYKVTAHLSLPHGGEATGLAVDADSRRIYVAGSSGLDVINADDGSAIATIAIPGGAGGVVLAPELGRGFVSERNSAKIIVFDLASGRTIKTVAVGRTPAALAFDTGTKRVFVADQGDDSVTAIDGASGAVVATAKLPGSPGQLEVNPYGSLYAALPGSNKVAVIGTGDVAYQGAIPVLNGDDCSGLALDPVGRRLFVGCANGDIAVVDTDTGFTFENVAGAKGRSTGTFVSRPDGKTGWKGMAVFANVGGSLTLVKMEAFIRYVAGGEIKLNPGLGPIAFDSKTHRIVVATSGSGGSGSELLVLSH